MSKPREFWIEQIEGQHCAFSVADMDGNSPVGEKFFVVEKSAYDELSRENSEMYQELVTANTGLKNKRRQADKLALALDRIASCDEIKDCPLWADEALKEYRGEK